MIAILLLLLVIVDVHKYIWTEKFQDNETIIFNMDDRPGYGFFSIFFFCLNHYIYCKKNNKNFKMKTDKWLFAHKNGWTDYFEPVELNDGNENPTIIMTSAFENIDNYSIDEYRKHIPEIYIYNNSTKTAISNAMTRFSLTPGNYDSIFIRRGDKMGSESVYIPDDKYVDLLLKKSPDCKKIYLQTDDYNSFNSIKKYIKEKDLKIEIFTLCHEDNMGTVVHNNQKEVLNNAKNSGLNSEYLNSAIQNLNNSKTVQEMNADEKYKHTMDMIIGIDIVLNSNICVTDYQSNVSRFIKLSHKNSDNVYNIDTQTSHLDYDIVVNPAFGFEKRDN
jgi:hypothetical protein